MGRIIELLWDCPVCGKTGVLGRHSACTDCGKVRSQGVKFYQGSEKRYVDENTAKTISREPDWICNKCGAMSPHHSASCYGCGSMRGSSKRVEPQKATPTKTWEGKPTTPITGGNSRDKVREANLREYENAPVVYARKKAVRVADSRDTDVIQKAAVTQDFDKVGSLYDAYIEEGIRMGYDKDDTSDNTDYDNIEIETPALETEETDSQASGNGLKPFLFVRGKLRDTAPDGEISTAWRLMGWRLAKVCVPLLLCIIVLFGVKAFNTPKDKYLVVTSLWWERTIQLLETRTYNESGWSLPRDARLTYTMDEIHHYSDEFVRYEIKTRYVTVQEPDGYEEIVTGTKDLGNGYMEELTSEVPKFKTVIKEEEYLEPVYRQVPVYQTKYYYEVDRLVKGRTIYSSGFDRKPYWGEYTLLEGEVEDASRSRTEKFYVVGYGKDESLEEFELTYDDWMWVQEGMEIDLRVSFDKRKATLVVSDTD